jgi:hypothetical protein
MSFVSRAHNFLKDQGELKGKKYSDIMLETVKFLLENAVGLKNAKSTDKIIKYLETKKIKINRNQWEILVLGPLRENKVFIASHKTKGMYIPEDEKEAWDFYLSYKKRILKETDRMNALEELISNEDW